VNTIREMTPSLKIELDINNSLKAKLEKHLPVDTTFTVPRFPIIEFYIQDDRGIYPTMINIASIKDCNILSN
jgi:hypothetical protein